MKLRLLLTAGLAVSAAFSGNCQTISWSGAADGVSWNRAGNWTGGVLPGPANDVLITGGAGTGVLISGAVSIRSLQCLKPLTISRGTLLLNAGSSTVSGLFCLTNAATLTVVGAGTSFAANGPTADADGNFYVKNGGLLRLPGLGSLTNSAYTTYWQADGAGSVLDVSAVTNLAVGSGSRLFLQAYNGGTVDLHRLTTRTNALWVEAQDPGSIVDLSGLSGRCGSAGDFEFNLKAQSGASILIPNVTQLDGASLSIADPGSVSTAQLKVLTNVTLTIDAAEPNFGGVTNVDDTSIYALNGGVARLTNVTHCLMNGYTTSWQADGAGSRVDVSEITTLAVGKNSRLYLEVYNGGLLDLHRLTTKTNALWVDAQDGGSVVDLSGLSGCYSSSGDFEFALSAQNGATILIPNVTQLQRAALTIADPGSISTAQLNLLTDVVVKVDGGEPNFGRLTNLDDTSLYAVNGGTARLTNVAQCTMNAYTACWQADGQGSLVDLSRLTALSVGRTSRLYLEAYNGGVLDLHRLATRSNALWVDARDPGSAVDLSGMIGRYTASGSFDFELAAQTGASILIPNLTELANATLSVTDTGSVSTAQLTLLSNVNLTLDGAVPNFGRLTNIDDTSIYTLNGGVARLTNINQAVMNAYTTEWQADGQGSLVDLSRLTNLAVGEDSRLYLEAYHGGGLDLHRLTTRTNALWIEAQDPGSLVDLSGLAGRYSTYGNFDFKLVAQAGGAVLIPNVTELERATLTLLYQGIVPTAQLRLLTNVELTVMGGAAPDLRSVTNLDDCTVYARDGGVAQLTNVTRAVMTAYTTTWQADEAGSVLDLSGLSELVVGENSRLFVNALSGARVDLSRLGDLATGAVQVEANGGNSVVDLRSLTGFTTVGDFDSNLAALNSGTILLNQQCMLLANVGINIPPGNPVLPPTIIASPAVTLYGKQGHSYWVEKRDLTQVGSPWEFLARVPLSGSFQVVLPGPLPNTEFRTYEFLADPPQLDLYSAPGQQVQLVLYGLPTQAYQIFSSPSMGAGTVWQPGGTVTLNNACQILPPTSAPDPARFFRAKKL